MKIGSDPKNSQTEVQILRNEISKSNSGDICLTIKNYNNQLGLSQFIHNDLSSALYSKQMVPLFNGDSLKMKVNCQQVFQVKGPMGQGLQVNPRGKHIAFTAGTGVLPFMDLIAHLILKLAEKEGASPILTELNNQ